MPKKRKTTKSLGTAPTGRLNKPSPKKKPTSATIGRTPLAGKPHPGPVGRMHPKPGKPRTSADLGLSPTPDSTKGYTTKQLDAMRAVTDAANRKVQALWKKRGKR